ncbi:MAG: fatty acid CoA ligase family protein [Myxococcota bacterium]
MNDILANDFNIADRLTEVAADRGSAWALADASHPDGRRLSFQELEEEVDKVALGFIASGFEPGDRVLMFLKPSFDFFVALWAAFRIGAVPVFIDPSMGTQPVLRAVRESAPRRVVANELVAWLARLYPRAFSSVETWIRPRTFGLLGTSFDGIRRRARDLGEDPRDPSGPDALAAILFTSGATGFPKGVKYTHRVFDAQRLALGSSLGIRAGEVDYSAFPLFSMFSLTLGASVVVPNMDTTRPGAVDPAPVLEAFEFFGVTFAFGSPAFWRRLVMSERKSGFRGLERLLMAGAPAPPDLLRRLVHLLSPHADVFTPYGATESLPVCMASGRENLSGPLAQTSEGAGTWLGRPLPQVELRIISISDEPLESWNQVQTVEPGTVGEIVVHSPMTTEGYFMRPVADASSKIRDDDGRLWHRMGDLGYLDEHGAVWYCGRKAHRVETPRGTLYPVQVEALVNQHPRVSRSALVGIGARGVERPVIIAECRSGERPRNVSDRRRLASEIRACSGLPDVERVLFRAALPVDARHNAKIRRDALKEWAERRIR